MSEPNEKGPISWQIVALVGGLLVMAGICLVVLVTRKVATIEEIVAISGALGGTSLMGMASALVKTPNKDWDRDGKPGISWRSVTIVLVGGAVVAGCLLVLLTTGQLDLEMLIELAWMLLSGGAAGFLGMKVRKPKGTGGAP